MIQFFDNEVPVGLVDGSNNKFYLTAAPDPVSSLILLRNGVVQILGVNYTVLGNEITFIDVPYVGDQLRAWYRTGGEAPVAVGGIYRDEAVQIIMDRLGMRTNIETLIIRHMKFVQTSLESKQTLPWFLVGAVDVSVSGDSFTVPESFIREIDDFGALWVVRDDGTMQGLDKFDYDVLATSEIFQGYGVPRAYAVYGDKVYLFPRPDKEYNMKFLFYRYDAPLDSNIKNRWLTHASRLMVSETGLSVARTLRDFEQAQIFGMEAREAWAELVRSNTARLQSAARSELGDYTL